jgi:hypothetical protein
MNYAELTAQIKNICENEFDATTLAMFTQQAEQKIYNSVQLANLLKTSTTALTSSTQTFNAPTDLLSVYSFAVVKADGSYVYLLSKEANFMQEAYPNPATTGLPKHYAFNGPASPVTRLQFILGPTPNAAYTTSLQYFYYPESIVTAGTTWLGEFFDSALLNGALIEALRYMKGEVADTAVYDKLYLQAITLLKNLGDGKQQTDSYRNGQTRTAVS